jgi:hypothetical protein
MSFARRGAIVAMAVLSVLVAGLMVSATPASAATQVYCSFAYPVQGHYCQTAVIRAHPSSRKLLWEAYPVGLFCSSYVSYRFWDIDTGATIRSGTFRIGNGGTVGGLYGRYRISVDGFCSSQALLKQVS